MLALLITGTAAAHVAFAPPGRLAAAGAMRSAALVMDAEADGDFGLAVGQKFGPTAPAHPMEKCARAQHTQFRPHTSGRPRPRHTLHHPHLTTINALSRAGRGPTW